MASVDVIAKVNLNNETGHKIRSFVCRCQSSEALDHNPLPEFNELLQEICQEAFEAGRCFERDPLQFIK